MKKIITALSMMAVLLLGACGTSNDPETILTKAYENMQKLESFTMIGKMNITVGSEDESALSIPINLEIKTIRHDLNNPDDDENYSNVNLSLLGESVTTETWSVDGMSYIKMGEGKYYTPLESITSVIDDPKAMAKRVVENCKEINVSKDGDKTILDLVVEEGKLPEVMSFTGAGNVNGLDSVGGDEILKNFKVERLHMLVSNDYHTESLLLEGTTESEGLKMLINMTLDIFDRNSATIPSFNKNEFVSEEEFQSQFGNEYNPIVSDPSGSTSYDFEPYEEIGFDTGETIAIDGNGQ
ncbi:MAG: hypothetical protein IKE51_05050, partial [Solobacterium sp.]|nr:hypothetical protein [Solobacterium sp.]